MFALPKNNSRSSGKKKKNKKKSKNKKQTNVRGVQGQSSSSTTSSAISHNGPNTTNNGKRSSKKRGRNHGTNNSSNSSRELAPGAGGTASSALRKKQRRSKESSLSDQFSSKLKGAQFRWLNEQLYTTDGKSSFDMFQKEPELFDVYHRGFREQAAGWRVNPLDIIISQLAKKKNSVVVADFGCGEARLAKTLQNQHVFHSFDLVAGNELITACDVAHVPLEDACVDVAVFCLALMGPNYVDFVKEACRVLKIGGRLKIAEVESRFIRDADASSLDSGVAAFTATLERVGFKRVTFDRSNDFFMLFEFEKIHPSTVVGGSSSRGGGGGGGGGAAGWPCPPRRASRSALC